MPAERYSQFWPRMPAFALPAFYDGRIRFNVAGREAREYSARDYEMACDRMIESLNQCRNLLNGKKVIAEIHRPKHDANSVGASEADLYVEWESLPLGIGPPATRIDWPDSVSPYRRVTPAPAVFFLSMVAAEPPGITAWRVLSTLFLPSWAC